MRIKATSLGIIVSMGFIMLFLPAVFAEEGPSGKEEIMLEAPPFTAANEKNTSEKLGIAFTGGAPKQKEKLPMKVDVPETPQVAAGKPVAVQTEVNTEAKQTRKDVTAKIYEPIIDKLMKMIQLAVKDKRPPAETEAEKINGQPAAAPFVRMVNDVLSGPQDFTSAIAKESVAITTVGGWTGGKSTRNKFNSEVGLAALKASREEKAPQVLTLKECLDIAVKNHLPLQTAKKSMRLAEIRVFEARRNLLPSFTAAMEESTGRVNSRAYISKKTYFEGQQPVFHGGELYYNLKQALANSEITKNDYERIKNDLILQVKKGYYSMAKAKENLKIQKELSDEVAKINEMVNKEFEANIASKLEFLNVSSQASQVKYQLASARGDLSIAELILKQAMNIDTRDRIDVAALPPFKKIELDFESTLYAALVNRPEMKINSLMIDYYNYGKGIARAKGLPKIDILGQWGMAKDEYMSQDASHDSAALDDDRKMEQQWYAGVKASMPIWGSTAEYTWTKEQWVPQVSVYSATKSDTHAIKLKILDKLDYYSDKKLAEIDFDKARQELVKIRQDITMEAHEGCFNYEKALIQMETASAKVAYQAKDLEVARFKRGLDEAADSNVIESMIKLAQERFGYAQAIADCHTTLATINKAIGVEDYYKDE